MSSRIKIHVQTKSEGETGVFFVAYRKTKKKDAERELVTKGVDSVLTKKVHDFFGEDFKSSFGQVIVFRDANLAGYKNLVYVGLGEIGHTTPDCVRRVAGQITRDLSLKTKTMGFSFDNIVGYTRDKVATTQSFAEGAVLGSYRFDELKNQTKPKPDDSLTLNVVCKNKSEAKSVEKNLHVGTVLGKATNFSRRLGDLPANYLTPKAMAEEAKHAAKDTTIKVTVWDQEKIEKEKMGNFVGVAKGSGEPGRFIIMEYKGGQAKQKPIILVGKGLTFDSGGISIKPSAGMEEMKYDMCGGAAVIGAMHAIATLKLKVHVIGMIAAAENMPSGTANKPGDVTVARNGKTTEVNNTDAEGRLVLSDVLCYASEKDPACILDAATLTGAIVVALGDTHTGYFTQSEKLAKTLEHAAQTTGEWMWRMPLTQEHSDDMKGTYADLSNISSNKGAGSAKGAAYLKEFVDEKIPWAHIDIAGTAWHTGHRVSYNPKKGASGVMVRTFVQFVQMWK